MGCPECGANGCGLDRIERIEESLKKVGLLADEPEDDGGHRFTLDQDETYCIDCKTSIHEYRRERVPCSRRVNDIEFLRQLVDKQRSSDDKARLRQLPRAAPRRHLEAGVVVKDLEAPDIEPGMYFKKSARDWLRAQAKKNVMFTGQDVLQLLDVIDNLEKVRGYVAGIEAAASVIDPPPGTEPVQALHRTALAAVVRSLADAPRVGWGNGDGQWKKGEDPL